MKKPLPPALIAAAAVVALALLGFVFVRSTGDPPPQAQNMPDYNKMSGEEIAAGRAAGDKAMGDAMTKRGEGGAR